MVPVNTVDIVKILTAATPIVASITNMVAKSKPEEGTVASTAITKPANISVTINNNFYTNSEKESSLAFERSQNVNNDQIVNAILSSQTRYNI